MDATSSAVTVLSLCEGTGEEPQKRRGRRRGKRLVKNGYQEFVLTGIHLSSYGVDCGDSLLELILAVHEIEGVKRIRLGSLEPRIITEEFVKTISSLSKICPHFHLSLQSGCDATLKRMNRRILCTGISGRLCTSAEIFEHPALTTVCDRGIPQESEEEFEASRAMIEA